MKENSGHWVRPDSQVPRVLEGLIQLSKDFSWRQGFGFYYDYQPGEGDNTDCRFYHRKDIGVVDRAFPTNFRFESANCNKDAYDLMDLLKNAGRSVAKALAGPFEKFYFSKYPVPEISARIQKANFDDQLLFELYNNLPTTSAWYKSTTYIPTITFKTYLATSLRAVAEKTTGNQDNWRLIWLLNIKTVTDPAKVPPDVKLDVPANVMKWKRAPLTMKSIPLAVISGEITKQHYGDTRFEPLVFKYVSTAKNAGLKEAWLPEFPTSHEFKKLETE